jgi:hypothetical protein
MLVFTQSVQLTLCHAGHESIEESSKIVPLGGPVLSTLHSKTYGSSLVFI